MKSMTEYHQLITVRLNFYSNTAVYGGNEYGKSSNLPIFTLLKHLMMLLIFLFLHLVKDIDSMQGHAAQIHF